jgi:CheY-like chemotaxis protein
MKALPSSPEPAIRILIAEDDESLCEILGEYLKRPGRGIRTCGDGAEALGALEENAWDMVIADLVMPGADGLQILKAARKSHPDAVVIIMTGHASLDSAIQAIRGGAYDYIRKPFKLDEIELVVNNGCEKIVLVRENRRLVRMLKETLDEVARLREGEDASWPSVVGEEGDPFGRGISEIDVTLKQMPPDHDLRRKEARDNALNSIERLIELRKEGFINQGEFLSLKKILLQRVSEL